MTASQAAGGEPGAPDRAVPRQCLERILRAGRGKPAAWRQEWRQQHLISANQRPQQTTWNQENRMHGSPRRKRRLAPGEELGPEHVEAGSVGLGSSPDHQVPGWLPRLNVPAPDLPQPPAQTIPGHRGCPELRNDESHPRLARLVVHPDHVQVLEATAAALGEATANVRRARKPMGSRKARRWRQEPPCFDGSDTVNRLRPFFRRRDRTARPQRVAIRARNPCLLMRRLFRGRYDGFIRGRLQSEPGKLVE